MLTNKKLFEQIVEENLEIKKEIDQLKSRQKEELEKLNDEIKELKINIEKISEALFQ